MSKLLDLVEVKLLNLEGTFNAEYYPFARSQNLSNAGQILHQPW